MYCEFPFLGRCCFCLPLRKGVLVFGYLNMLFSLFMLGVYSYYLSISDPNDNMNLMNMMYHGSTTSKPAEFCIFIYCVEIVFNVLLLYGAHQKVVLHLKIFFYFVITTIVASVAMQVIDATMGARWPHHLRLLEMAILIFAGLCLQIYLAILVRSLIKKLEVDGDNIFENQLHQIESGERKVQNQVYDNCTVIGAEDN